MAPGCYSFFRGKNTMDDWRLVRLPDQPGGVVQDLWFVDGSFGVWDSFVDGLEVFDGRFWACSENVFEFDPISGHWAQTPQLCDAMFVLDGKLQVAPHSNNQQPWALYESAASLRSGTPDGQVNRLEWPFLSKGAEVDGKLYGVWHNADHAMVLDPVTDTWRDQTLEDFDTWFLGISNDGGGPDLRIIDDGRSIEGIDYTDIFLWTFDSGTGAVKGDKIVVGDFNYDRYHGLWCGEPVITVEAP